MGRTLWSLLLLLSLITTSVYANESTSAGAEIETVTSQDPPAEELSQDPPAEELVTATKEITLGQPVDPDRLFADIWTAHSLGAERLEAAPAAYRDSGRVVVNPIVIERFSLDIDTLSSEHFMERFPMGPGEVLDSDALDEAVARALHAILSDTGLVFYETAERTLDDFNVIHMQFRSARVASITIQGNDKTSDFVIEREIETKVGDPLNVKVVREDLRRLSELGLFQDERLVVSLHPRQDESPLVDVVYHVVERRTGSIGFGAAYDPVEKLVGYVDFADNNLFGKGRYGTVRWEFGGANTSYELRETFRPDLEGNRIPAGFSLYHRSIQTEYGEEFGVGGTISVGRRLADFLLGSVRLRFEEATSIPRDNTAPIIKNRTRSVQFSLLGDTTDQSPNPTAGNRFRASTEIALEVLGGNTAYTKYEAAWSTYQKVGENGSIIAVRLLGGFSDDELPYQERFGVGGPDTVRAVSYGAALGEKMLVGNVEYRMALSDRVQAVVFADSGNAWRASDAVVLSDLMTSVGFGIRFDTALAALRLDYGFGENGGLLNFGIGPSF